MADKKTLYKVRHDGCYSGTEFIFEDWTEAVGFAGIVVDSGVYNGKPLSAEITKVVEGEEVE